MLAKFEVVPVSDFFDVWILTDPQLALRTVSNNSNSEELIKFFEILEFISGEQGISNTRRLRNAIFSRYYENIVNIEEEENTVVICE